MKKKYCLIAWHMCLVFIGILSAFSDLYGASTLVVFLFASLGYQVAKRKKDFPIISEGHLLAVVWFVGLIRSIVLMIIKWGVL